MTKPAWGDPRPREARLRRRRAGGARRGASRPHRSAISAAAPGVRVSTASAASTRTPSCASCRSALVVVRVAQVVHRAATRGRPWRRRLDTTCGEVVGRHGIEAEVDVHDVELVRVRVDPAGLEHPRRPPLRVGHVGARTRVGQPRHRRVAVGRGEVADVDVACGDGCDDGTQPVASRCTPPDAPREGAPARVRGAAGLEPPRRPIPGWRPGHTDPADPARYAWFRRTGRGGVCRQAGRATPARSRRRSR